MSDTKKANGEATVPPSRNRRQWIVVSYDIPDDKRRTKVMKTLEGYGRRAQYSVFECELRPAAIRKLKSRLRDLIDEQQDDLRFYPLCDNCVGKVTTMGKAQLYRHEAFVVV